MGNHFKKLSRKPLKDIMDLPNLLNQTPNKIEEVWNTYHSVLPYAASCVMSSSQYMLLTKRIKECPYFIYRISARKRNITLISQATSTFSAFHLSSDMEKDNSFASPYLCIDFYNELTTSKLIAPVRTIIDIAKLAKSDGDMMMRTFLYFYLTEEGITVVRQFNNSALDVEAYTKIIMKLSG